GVALNGNPGGFEIQGGVVATAAMGHTDWIANGGGTTGLLTNPGGVPMDSTVTYRRLDAYNGTDDIFSGSHAINDNPNTYTWKTASAGNKGDLNNVYQWKSVAGTYQWVDITASIGAASAYVATNTVDGVSVPYGAFGGTTYSKNQFVEMSIDATALIQANVDPCSGIAVRSVFV